jgi:hypothetical protein
MTVRTIERLEKPAVPCNWQQRFNNLAPAAELRLPEPTQLYILIAVTLALHEPNPESGTCECCQRAWPCEPVRLAYRLREGF